MSVLTIPQAAARLGVYVQTVRNHLRRGTFPNAYRTGDDATSPRRREWRIPEGDLVYYEYYGREKNEHQTTDDRQD